MRQSKLFTKTRREAPSDEISKNAELLIRAGFINKEMAGVYSLLPLGFKVVNNIKKIISKDWFQSDYEFEVNGLKFINSQRNERVADDMMRWI